MKFYIVTPTYNALAWLQRCVRSVADQVCEQVEVHHHVQDGGSADGTPAWLAAWQQEHAHTPGYTLTYQSAPDAGMYDAINKAWAQMPADADVTAHLNSDEQYLPNALVGIVEGVIQCPKADIIVSSFMVIDSQGSYVCHRRSVMPRKWISRTVCEIITCTAFHKASTFKRHGIRFDVRWRSIGDVIFFRDIVYASLSIKVMPNLITSVFTQTGTNLQWSLISQSECAQLSTAEPWYIRKLHGIAYRWSHLKGIVTNMLCSVPKRYAVFCDNSNVRKIVEIQHPTCFWRKCKS